MILDFFRTLIRPTKRCTNVVPFFVGRSPIPVTIIAEMLGVPTEMSAELLRWSHDMVQMYEMQRTPESELAAVKASQEFVGYLHAFVESRRRDPANDLVSELIAVEAEGQRLTEDELIANLMCSIAVMPAARIFSAKHCVQAAISCTRTLESSSQSAASENRSQHQPCEKTRWC